MRSRQSKHDSGKDFDTLCKHPNVQYMINNYGRDSVKQLKIWIECGFPEKGSFSERQLEILRDKLKEYEKVGKKQNDKVDWSAFYMWMTEAQLRARKSTLKKNTDSANSVQCLKSVADPDLDGFPPRPVAPAQPQLPQHPVRHRQVAPPPQRRDNAVQEQRPD